MSLRPGDAQQVVIASFGLPFVALSSPNQTLQTDLRAARAEENVLLDLKPLAGHLGFHEICQRANCGKSRPI